MVDASDFSGISFSYKGSSIPFGVSVYHSDVKDWDHFSTILMPSEEWKSIKLSFEQLKQFGYGNQITWSAKRLTGLNFVWRIMPGEGVVSAKNQFEIKSLSYF